MVFEEVLSTFHTPLNFNSTEIISQSCFWSGCLHLCQRASPDLECEPSRKFRQYCHIEYKSATLQASIKLASWLFSSYFIFFPFLYSSTPIGYSPIHSWITPFLHVFSKSSDLHGNQATVSTSATQRPAHGSPWKDLTFYILIISVFGYLQRNYQGQKERSRQVMTYRALPLCHHLGVITLSPVSLKIFMLYGVELAVYRYWGFSLFLSA